MKGNLPNEIWQQIASYLTLREWAQFSGTCKATWSLQLQDIEILKQDCIGAAGTPLHKQPQFSLYAVCSHLVLLLMLSCVKNAYSII